MGRPPLGGGPVFRFTPSEVMEMEACLQGTNNVVPDRALISALAEKFSASADRNGKVVVQPKQVWNWFQNRRYAQRAKVVKVPGKLNVMPIGREEPSQLRNMAPPAASAQGKSNQDGSQMEFEAKSARDGAWYDVAQFISHRLFETGDPEVLVRFAGFGVEEDEWVNVRRCVRQRSLPCEAAECVVVLPGDLILCFQEGKEQALYFDAHVLDAQRRRHDARGCRCRFLVRYDHDQSEEIVPLRKVCRRPETEYRLRILQATKAAQQGAATETVVPVASLLMQKQPSDGDVREAVVSPMSQKQPDSNSAEVVSPPSPQLVAEAATEPVVSNGGANIPVEPRPQGNGTGESPGLQIPVPE
ncbi:protein SAWADEE HOMEODOMAIN HOMOLOG 2-like [Wolffia australiana]